MIIGFNAALSKNGDGGLAERIGNEHFGHRILQG
jgi:hypothetical protein